MNSRPDIKCANYAKCTNVTNALNMTNQTKVTKLYRYQILQLI